MPEILTTEELADELRTPIHTINYWRARGTGPKGFRLGKRVVYRRTDVEAWLEQKAAADPMSSRPATS